MDWIFKIIEYIGKLLIRRKEEQERQKIAEEKKNKDDARIAIIIYENITGIENYIKHNHSSDNMYISSNWEKSLEKCDFLTPKERELVRKIYIEAKNFHDNWAKRNEDGIYRSKADVPSYQELQKFFLKGIMITSTILINIRRNMITF